MCMRWDVTSPYKLSSYCLIGLFRGSKNTFMTNTESRGSPQFRLCYITVGTFFPRSQSDRKIWTAKVWIQTEQRLLGGLVDVPLSKDMQPALEENVLRESLPLVPCLFPRHQIKWLALTSSDVRSASVSQVRRGERP